MSARKVITVLAAIAVLGGGVAIVASSMSSGVFSLSVQEVLASGDRLEGREFKVAGAVMPGSFSKDTTPFEWRFAVSDKEGRRLDCHYRGSVPDPFAEGREVILQGTRSAEGRMEVGKITVKCPSKYEEAGVTEDRAAEYYQQKYRDGHRKL